jgi:periplasmic protein CpxP/Spy
MMKLHTKLTLGLVSSLFAASLATAATSGTKMGPYHAGMGCDGMGMMSGDMKRDPVARAQKHLSELNAKLNLTADQQPAWKTFSEQVNDQAKNMVAMRDQMKGNFQSMPKKTAPERMAKMADLMNDRAQNMARMADAVKTFYATLTAEQQATFDKMQMSQMGRKQ